jgi:hypothetical protein
MICFLIPLRSEKSSSNWDLTVKLLNNTLKSVFNQTEPQFRVMIACHEIPTLAVSYDARLEIIQVNYPPPEQVKDHLTDKYYKKRILVRRAQEHGGKYIMFVDADDYISNRLVNWVKNHDHPSGWFIETGYEYDASSNNLRITPKFNNICGTSAILNISVLIGSVETGFTEYERVNKYLFDYGHNEWNRILKERKEHSLGVIPYRAAVYIMNTGVNWTQTSGQQIGHFRRIFRFLHPRIKADQKFRQEFCFTLPDFTQSNECFT